MKQLPYVTPRERTWGWAWYGFELLALPSLLMLSGKSLGLSNLQVNFLYYFLKFAFVFLIFRRFLLENLARAGECLRRVLEVSALGYAALEAGSFAVGRLIGVFFPEFANVNDASLAAMASQGPVMLFVSTVVLVPLAEEVLFRSLIFGEMLPRSRWGAYLISALAFCAVHVTGYVGLYPAGLLALCFLQYLPAGLILALIYEKTGTIFAPVVIHTAVNLTAMMLL